MDKDRFKYVYKDHFIENGRFGQGVVAVENKEYDILLESSVRKGSEHIYKETCERLSDSGFKIEFSDFWTQDGSKTFDGRKVVTVLVERDSTTNPYLFTLTMRDIDGGQKMAEYIELGFKKFDIDRGLNL